MPAEDRTAVITGASSGVGRATALRLARGGWHPVLVARRESELDKTRREIEDAGGSATVVPADLARLADIEAVVIAARQFTGRIDALVNVAGLGHGSSIMTDDEHALRMVAINLLAPARLMRAVTPIMRAQGSGAIVNIGSVAGEIGVSGIYSATKFGLRGLTDSVRRELSGTGIAVSLIEPTYIATPMTAGRPGRMPGPDIVARAVQRVLFRPRRRVIVPASFRVSLFFATRFPAVTDRMYAGRVSSGA